MNWIIPNAAPAILSSYMEIYRLLSWANVISLSSLHSFASTPASRFRRFSERCFTTLLLLFLAGFNWFRHEHARYIARAKSSAGIDNILTASSWQIIIYLKYVELKLNMLICTKRQASKGYLKTCLSLFCLYFYVLSDSNVSWVYPLLVRKGQFALLRNIEFFQNRLFLRNSIFLKRAKTGFLWAAQNRAEILPYNGNSRDIFEPDLTVWHSDGIF